MTLEVASIPLAFVAGLVGIMSPCVWPLVPVVMSSAATSGRRGALFLALGLSSSFAVAGTFVTLLLLNLGFAPDAYRHFAALLLVLVALMLLVKGFGDWVSTRLSRVTSRFGAGGQKTAGAAGQFGVGALLGLVWLPCVGPTLGAAVALASLGQNMGHAFAVMFAFGFGTAAALVMAGLISGEVLRCWRPGLMTGAVRGRKLLGLILLVLGFMVITGADKVVEVYALRLLPEWIYGL